MFIHAGNLPQFFDRQGWQFHRVLSERFGGVVKLTMPFGVRFLQDLNMWFGTHSEQATWLFVFDPKALHEIVVKHQDVYEETPIFRT